MATWVSIEKRKPTYFRICSVMNEGHRDHGRRTKNGWIAEEGGYKLRDVTKWYYVPE